FLPFFFTLTRSPRCLLSFPTRRSSDLRFDMRNEVRTIIITGFGQMHLVAHPTGVPFLAQAGIRVIGRGEDALSWWYIAAAAPARSEEHTSELQSRENLVCRLLLEKKKR